MDWQAYTELFDSILEGKITEAPYDKEAYLEYVKLNKSRMNRWFKKNPISAETIAVLKNIEAPQHWILIAEPWCGDAAHSAPILQMMAAVSPKVSLEIVLRDSSEWIDSYLTNGSKSIPKLVVRDAAGADLFVWGPRPAACQKLVMEMKETDLSPQERNVRLQNWYNENGAEDIQRELREALASVIV